MPLYAGVEGGTSSSKVVLVDSDGNMLLQLAGEHTNHWHLGISEAAKRINFLITKAVNMITDIEDKTILAAGLCLSGIDFQKNADDLKEQLITDYPCLCPSGNYYISNDSVGPLAAVSLNGGVILISGTGSICNYIRKDWTYQRVGGMGHFLGDAGSGYWISKTAISELILHEDGVKQISEPLDTFKKAFLKYFDIKDTIEILKYFGTDFSKAFISDFTEIIAQLANDGDLYCMKWFKEAGFHLGRLVSASCRNMDDVNQLENVKVLCVGQVFKGFKLIEEGFIDGIKPIYNNDPVIKKLSLIQLNVPAAYGAALLSMKKFNAKIDIDLTKNYQEIFSYTS